MSYTVEAMSIDDCIQYSDRFKEALNRAISEDRKNFIFLISDNTLGPRSSHQYFYFYYNNKFYEFYLESFGGHELIFKPYISKKDISKELENEMLKAAIAISKVVLGYARESYEFKYELEEN